MRVTKNSGLEGFCLVFNCFRFGEILQLNYGQVTEQAYWEKGKSSLQSNNLKCTNLNIKATLKSAY